MKINMFVKSHGLGNDYIVLDSDFLDFELTKERVIRICDIHFGIGSDGILLKTSSKTADFGLLIYNTDGSLAENCGNGLRIFSKFLVDYGYTNKSDFTIEIMGRLIHSTIIENTEGRVSKVSVEMGKANFTSPEIPLVFHKNECIHEAIQIDNKEFIINCVSVGNPHCVVFRDTLDYEELCKYAPQIQALPMFPNGVNVQFAKRVSDTDVEILIYERGVGYTLASGSSSCAVASVMVKNKLTHQNVSIHMPGGTLGITISSNWDITMTGPAQEIAHGILNKEMLY